MKYNRALWSYLATRVTLFIGAFWALVELMLITGGSAEVASIKQFLVTTFLAVICTKILLTPVGSLSLYKFYIFSKKSMADGFNQARWSEDPNSRVLPDDSSAFDVIYDDDDLFSASRVSGKPTETNNRMRTTPEDAAEPAETNGQKRAELTETNNRPHTMAVESVAAGPVPPRTGPKGAMEKIFGTGVSSASSIKEKK